jgi:hypothetical protein
MWKSAESDTGKKVAKVSCKRKKIRSIEFGAILRKINHDGIRQNLVPVLSFVLGLEFPKNKFDFSVGFV